MIVGVNLAELNEESTRTGCGRPREIQDTRIKPSMNSRTACRLQRTGFDGSSPTNPQHIYGYATVPTCRTKRGTYANNCLLARRLAERGVRLTQIFHRGWDQHNNLPKDLPNQCRDIDQPTNALLTDLKERGLLDDTLVVWGGEFGRTIYCQGKLTRTNYGRDHHPKCFTMWMAGAGIKGGVTHGITDDFSYNVVMDPVHIRDINATILQQLGIDHELLSIKYQGLNLRLTGVEEARPIKEIMV